MSCPPGLSSILAANSATQWLSEPGKEEGGKAGPEEEVESGRTGAGERVVKISPANEDRLGVAAGVLQALDSSFSRSPRL